MAEESVLAELVKKTLTDGQAKLDDQEQARFHRQFKEQISPEVEKLREEKRKSYDRNQDLAFW